MDAEAVGASVANYQLIDAETVGASVANMPAAGPTISSLEPVGYPLQILPREYGKYNNNRLDY